MALRGVDDRLPVRGLHADVESCDDLSAHLILAGNVNAAFQLQVVNGKTWNFFHISIICH